ncbi:CRISPR-associated endoribonuclease Cas2 (plasmid) [Dolichospermum sp. UHCC 0315A]|uniref:CRISPR-associated endonuclease Cas2 n=1 Tax=Dolichospermum sp. UHCC 0315A TaxID=1914871 RepID=UPI00125A69E4|nr:CRISPR-associated endonuclease Cas2 [Dolichospermum sp. UHCC 0315A]QEI44291.1 CRISPR-associated endoribonuclease Cas2 [Dolichospermum sp. UHCC 0315A]QEI44348.1 CRISPR-associated endoribonuclease Cas2 [Dolichospermum sp. UHCC 0315A]
MNVVISYDISEDKRRTKIHSILKSYGQWVQYSIFECELTDTQYAKLRSRLNKLIKPETDSIRLVESRGNSRVRFKRHRSPLP